MEKTLFRWYTAGAFRENAADLDRRSREGWNLKKPGCLRYTFVREDRPCRYGLDYCPAGFGEEARKEREAACAAAGWKPVGSTATGWTYYEKPVGPDDDGAPLPIPYTAGQEKALAAVSRWFWIRAAVVAAGIPPAAVAVVRQQSMFAAAIVYGAAILACCFRIQLLQRQLSGQDPTPR